MEKESNNRSEQILDLAAQRRQEKQVVDVEVEKTLIVVFQLSGDGGPRPASGPTSSPLEGGVYGLPATAVESIVAVKEITYVPGTPPWILGVVNVRGEIESVLDLKAVLALDRPDLRAEITPESRLLIAKTGSAEGDLRSGLLVDRMVDTAYIPVASIRPPPAPLEGGKGVYIAGEAEYGEQTLVILDLAEIFHRALETDRV